MKYFVNKDIYCIQRQFIDCDHFSTSPDDDSENKTLEEFIMNPNLMKKGFFEPTEMNQLLNTQLNFEFIFLLTDIKITVLGRKIKINADHQEVFLAYFTIDYLDVMSIKRRMTLQEEFCDIEDFPAKKQDPLGNLTGEENILVQKRQPLNRIISFDIDDDIVITPNFNSRKGNSLLVIPANVWVQLL